MIFWNYIYRASNFLRRRVSRFFCNRYTHILFRINRVFIGDDFVSNGVPKLFIHHTARISIGTHFRINNTILGSPIGRNCRCLFSIRENSRLTIGDNVGLSGTMIFCQAKIKIGNNVKIGGNVCIYDTDFHSLNLTLRKNSKTDQKSAKIAAIIINDNVFIGAHSTILKGVVIGENSIIGACSLVSKSIPKNEIWGGNPAKFIRTIDDGDK